MPLMICVAKSNRSVRRCTPATSMVAIGPELERIETDPERIAAHQ
jgi:hypothetical protein